MGSGLTSYKLAKASDSDSHCSAPDWLAERGSKLSAFNVENVEKLIPIGKGKFGLVFLSKHKPSSKIVAVKFIPKQVIFENESLSRIQQEMNILQKLDHPFVVRFFGGFETSNCVALVFDYCFGGELYHLMKKNNKMPENMAKFYFCELALALHYLHNTLNIVYRDLKPENILIDVFGHVKLCDFGFAVPLDDEAELLKDGCGTAMYVAPEIAGGFMRNQHGYPVDWWSLGCVLMEMITGSAPFGDSDSMSKFEIFNNINEKSVRYPLSMTISLKTLIKGLLDKDPKTRYNWLSIKESTWVEDVNWDDFLSCSILPPWVPKIPKTPTAENFVKWDLVLPADTPQVAAKTYCRDLVIPRPIQLNGSIVRSFSINSPSFKNQNQSLLVNGNRNNNNNSNKNNNQQIRSFGSVSQDQIETFGDQTPTSSPSLQQKSGKLFVKLGTLGPISPVNNNNINDNNRGGLMRRHSISDSSSKSQRKSENLILTDLSRSSTPKQSFRSNNEGNDKFKFDGKLNKQNSLSTEKINNYNNNLANSPNDNRVKRALSSYTVQEL
eukprot:gene10546-14168_t